MKVGDRTVELVQAKEVREYLGISHMLERRMRDAGFLRGVKIGGIWFYYREGLEDALRRWRALHPPGRPRKERRLFR